MIGHFVLEMIRQALGGHGRVRGPGEGPPRDTSARVDISRSGITGIGGMRGVTQQYAREHNQTLARVETPKTISPTVMRTPTTPTLSAPLKARRQI